MKNIIVHHRSYKFIRSIINQSIFILPILSAVPLTSMAAESAPAAQTKGEPKVLTLVVDNLKSGIGQVGLTLFEKKEAEAFPTKPQKALLETYFPLKGQTTIRINLEDIPEGTYAAFIYHDEDSNKKINSNFMHIPTEGYGASQGAPSRFGPPKFEDAQFLVKYTEPVSNEFKISVKY